MTSAGIPPRRPNYRLYIDEVGNTDMGPSMRANERYLSLTGVIVDLEHVASSVHPRLEELKERHLGAPSSS
jgi:hypothetical protein